MQASGSRGGYFRKNISEYKAVSGVPTFAGGERGQYNEWQVKFTNSMAQVRPGLRNCLLYTSDAADDM
eukprot:75377-Alexandrium_andersonii.AAC.1